MFESILLVFYVLLLFSCLLAFFYSIDANKPVIRLLSLIVLCVTIISFCVTGNHYQQVRNNACQHSGYEIAKNVNGVYHCMRLDANEHIESVPLEDVE